MIRHLLRNKTFLGTLCIILALVVGFGIVPAFNAQTRKTVKVYRAKSTIYEYQQITDKMIESVEVGAYGLPGDAIRNEKDVVGKLARTRIVPGDKILAGQLMTSDQNSDEFMNEISKEGKRAVAVTLPTLASSIAGRIMTGDVVSVVTFDTALSNGTGSAASSAASSPTSASSAGSGGSFNNGIQSGGTTASQTVKNSVIYPELQHLQIVAMSAKDGTPVNGLTTATTGADGKTSIQLPSVVVFACTDKQANLLAQIEKKNDLYLEFVARGSQAEQIMKQDAASSK